MTERTAAGFPSIHFDIDAVRNYFLSQNQRTEKSELVDQIKSTLNFVKLEHEKRGKPFFKPTVSTVLEALRSESANTRSASHIAGILSGCVFLVVEPHESMLPYKGEPYVDLRFFETHDATVARTCCCL